MRNLHQRSICWVSAFVVILFELASPSFITISGVSPSWSVLWLLPFSLVAGPFFGAFAGLCFGLVLDGLSLSYFTQVPAFVILGWWWGNLGRRSTSIERSWSLGLLAWIGTGFVGLTFLFQINLTSFEVPGALLNAWALNTLLVQAMLTGLLAPLISTWLLTVWRRGSFISLGQNSKGFMK